MSSLLSLAVYVSVSAPVSLALPSLPAGSVLVAASPQEEAAVSKPTSKPTGKPTAKSDVPEEQRKYLWRRQPLEQRKATIPGSQPVIFQGLIWLRQHQDPSGKWDCDDFMALDKKGEPCDGKGNAVHDVGVTGLALLAFLGEGITTKHGAHHEQVKKAVHWLIAQQDPAMGRFGGNRHHDFIYDHCIAAYAMCEAYGLSGEDDLKKPAQLGIDYLEKHRNPYAGWRYRPRDGDNDMSVTSWAVAAYGAGRDFGLEVNEKVFPIVRSYVDKLTEPDSGRVGYTAPGQRSSRKVGGHIARFPPEAVETMTAAGLFCRFLLKQDPAEEPIMEASGDTILAALPAAEAEKIDYYYWYYGSHAMFQLGGKHWADWSKALVEAVVKRQRKDGNFRGSWDPKSVWGEDGGRIYSTALAILTLQSQYRYARIFDR
jgi:hypothetical protein